MKRKEKETLLVQEIEARRNELNQRINRDQYEQVLKLSQELDRLIEQYIVSEF